MKTCHSVTERYAPLATVEFLAAIPIYLTLWTPNLAAVDVTVTLSRVNVTFKTIPHLLLETYSICSCESHPTTDEI